MTTIDVRALKTLSDQLTAQFRAIRAEWETIPQQRTDAAGKAELLNGISRRQADLETANKLQKEAAAKWTLAANALGSDPATVGKEYAAALTLSTDIQAILDYRKDEKVAPKSAEPAKGTDGKGDGDAPAPVPVTKTDGSTPASKSAAAPASTDSPAEKAKKDGGKGTEKDGGDSSTDPVLAAITKLGEECRKGNDELRQEIVGVSTRLDELAKGTLPEELAKALSGLDPEVAKIIAGLKPETLRAVLNGRGLSNTEAALLAELTKHYASPADFARDLQALSLMVTGSTLDRWRFITGGSNAPRRGAHA